MSRVTLTFDNGPDPEGTPRVLEVLRRRGVEATFFAQGSRLAAAGGLALARRVVEEGHRLGNHTYSHEVPLGRDPRPDAPARELGRTHALLEQAWGPRVRSGTRGDAAPERLFRPFGGQGALGPHLMSEAAVRWLERMDYTCVLWTSVPGDFRDADGWVARALEDVAAQDHALVVLHDAAPAAMRHLDRFIGALQDAGHALIPELPEAQLPLIRGARRPGLGRYVQRAPGGAPKGANA